MKKIIVFLSILCFLIFSLGVLLEFLKNPFAYIVLTTGVVITFLVLLPALTKMIAENKY